MTIAISLKVNDGVVLAADSASTLITQDDAGNQLVSNIYNNANKVFNLVKGSPIGLITWGAGSIGTASISTLIKDLRREFSNADDKTINDYIIDPQSYTIKEVADKVRTFMFLRNYQPTFKDWKSKPALGFIVAGYGSKEAMAEEYQIDIINGECGEPRLLRSKEDSGLTWNGEPEAITRLIIGHGMQLPMILENNLRVPKEQIGPVMQLIRQNLHIPLVLSAMPIQDAIDLAEFLVDLTIKFSRFAPGAPTVGGPIEIAAITKHEGFKWVRRKYYFKEELNPEVK